MEDVFDLLTVISKGFFNDVYLARVRGRSLHDLMAIRLMPKSKVTSDMATAELMVLRMAVSVPYIAQLATCFQTPAYFAVVLAYPTVSGGSLYTRIKRHNRFSELVARFYMAEIAEGLFHLHDRAIIHRNLTVNNVMIKDDGHVVLSDFGLSYVGIPSRDLPNIDCAAWYDTHVPQLPAPEIMMGQPYNKMVDWWSFGIILYRLICGKLPVSKQSGIGSVANGALPRMVYTPEPYPNTISPEAKAFLTRLLARHPQRRIGHGSGEQQEVRDHPFFSATHWSLVRSHALPPPFTDCTVAGTARAKPSFAFCH